MKKLPTDMALPTVEQMTEYLDGQEDQVRRLNFNALFNMEVQRRRLEKAKKNADHEAAQSAKDEIEKSEAAIEGNSDYLEELQKMRRLI